MIVPLTNTVTSSRPPFNPDNYKYKFCCTLFHTRLGTWIIAVCWGLVTVYNLVSRKPMFYYPVIEDTVDVIPNQFLLQRKELPIITSIIIGFDIFVLICMLLSLYYKRHLFLIPYLVRQFITLCMIFVMLVVLIFGGFLVGEELKNYLVNLEMQRDANSGTPRNYIEYKYDRYYTWLCIKEMLDLSIDLWMYSIVHGCYSYFRDRRYHSIQMVTYHTPFVL